MIKKNDCLYHYGIKGQKWGVRRFQNEDRTWTEAGKERYGSGSGEHRDSSGRSTSEHHGINKETAKTVAKVALATAAVAGTAYLYSQNKDQIDTLIKNSGDKIASKFSDSAKSGKDFVDKQMNKDPKAVLEAKTEARKAKALARQEARNANMSAKIQRRADRQKERFEAQLNAKKEMAIAKKKAANDLAKELKEQGFDDEEVKKALYDFNTSAKDKMVDAVNRRASSVKKSVTSSSKRAVSSVKSTANKASNAVKSVTTPKKKTFGEKLKTRATQAAAGYAIGKVAGTALDNKLNGDKKLAEKREQNRHEEEMYRIRRNKGKR